MAWKISLSLPDRGVSFTADGVPDDKREDLLDTFSDAFSEVFGVESDEISVTESRDTKGKVRKTYETEENELGDSLL